MKVKSFFVLLYFLNNFSAFSQIKDYEDKKIVFQTLEGFEKTIDIMYNWNKEKILVQLNPKETFCFMGAISYFATVINNKFISIFYHEHEGTGVFTKRYILLCVANNKLFKALDIISVLDDYNIYSNMPKNEIKESYHYYFSLLNLIDSNKSYKLLGIQNEKVLYKYLSSKNYEIADTIKLNFDTNNKIFYNESRKLVGKYVVYATRTKPETKIILKGTYPLVKLKYKDFYFINNVWYEELFKDHFYSLSE